LIDVDDLVDALNTLWTEADSVFIHEMMRVQVTFLLLLYSNSGARLGAFLENGMAAVKRKDGQKDTLMFEGLTWKVRWYPYGHRSPRRLIRRLTISQDVHVYLFPLPDGSTEVILKLVQRWTKNNKDPENSVYVLPVLVPCFDPSLNRVQDRGSSLRAWQTETRHYCFPTGPRLQR
jgi:hypothetical protein